MFLAVVIVALGTVGLAFRQGLVPPQWSPLPIVDLSRPDGWLIDWRLAELKTARSLCDRVLRPPFIEAQAVADQPIADGCGWVNAVKISALSGAKLATERLTCQSAAGLALWVAHDVQPAAMAVFGQKVTAIRQFGTYACRNVAGNPMFKRWRSAHATANAIDIAAFTLADGHQISIAKHWNSGGSEADFLRRVHARACRYFHVAIGPDYNAAHHDHFHLDRGVGSVCR